MGATSGNMTWEQIQQAFLEACGSTTASRQESFSHITQGFRHVVDKADVPEVFGTTQVEVLKDPREAEDSANPFLDYIELDQNIHSIFRMFNLTIGAPVYREPSGMRGRDRYIDRFANALGQGGTVGTSPTSPKPPPGQVRWWCREGNRIYLRDTPAPSTISNLNGTALRIVFRIAIEPITKDVLEDHPFTPAHLDWAIVHIAASYYYMAHRDVNQVGMGPAAEAAGERGQQSPSQYHMSMGETIMGLLKQVAAEEDKDSFHRMRVAGYQVTPRSRR